MKPQLISHLRKGLIALGAVVGLSLPAMAGPAGYVPPPAKPAVNGPAGAGTIAPTKVGWICTYGNGMCRDNDTGVFRHRGQIKGNSHVLDGVRVNRHRGWSGKSHWDDDWRWKKRRHVRRHHRGFYGPSLFFSFGIPTYRYVDPYYDYYVPPRRVIRRSINLSAAHVAWCYDRWRSYREWDNTYQPKHGRRKQCISPYS